MTVTGDPPTQPDERPSLTARSSSGTLWTAISLVAGKGIVAVSTVVLGRVLDADVFGLFGIGLLVIGYLEFFNNFGIASAVINLTGKDQRLASIAFWVNMVLGVVMTAVTWLAAPFVADFFNENRATSIIRALGFVFLIRSIGAVHDALLKRDLAMKPVTIAETIMAFSKAVLTIVLALIGFGVWSLVWGQLVGALLGSLVFWVVNPWRPERATAMTNPFGDSKQLLGFGSQMTLIDILGALNKNVDYLFIGRAIGTTALGVYTMAFRLPELLIDGINVVAAKVAFPLFSQLQDQRDKGKLALLKMLRLTSAVAVPTGVGLALVAEPLVRAALGDKWTQVDIGGQVVSTVDPLRWIALALTVTALTKNIGDLYKGYGRPGLLNIIGVVRILFVIPLLIVAVRFGITGVAIAQLLAATVVSIAQVIIASRVVGLPLSDLVAPYRSPLISAAVMAAATWPVIDLTAGWNAFAQLVSLTIVGTVAYLATLVVVDRPLVNEGA
ncbi:MAG: lipopolysaccharide biosynthesis protein, partial [Acidimicrobiia bacterium]|nr:lipopolysaccharide biosynthesis protein [Acidimicrobiia bacterium]